MYINVKVKRCINVIVSPKMYVLADFMSTKQHTLCDCSYENENIFIYHEFYLVYSPHQEIAMM